LGRQRERSEDDADEQRCVPYHICSLVVDIPDERQLGVHRSFVPVERITHLVELLATIRHARDPPLGNRLERSDTRATIRAWPVLAALSD
jgi:hypothetical protein